MQLININTVIKSFIRHCNSGNHPLHGSTLIGSVMAIVPFLYVDYATNEIQGGVAMDMLKTIAEYYKFNYQVGLSDNVFAFFPNGTIGGSLGEVM